MSLRPGRLAFRLAVVSAVVAAAGLVGCGRKGPLDPPPAAVAGPAPTAGSADPRPADGFDDQGRPIAPPSSGQRTVLDWLLN